ncbi:MAG: 3-coathanger stack domain-containing protein [Bacteroidota bacterium]
MYHKYLFQLCFISLFFIALASTAQKIPPDLGKKIAGKTNLEEIMAEVDAYYQEGKAPSLQNVSREDEFENPYIFWKRFEHYQAARLDEKGNISPNVNQTIWNNWNAYKLLKPNYFNNPTQNSSYGTWSNLGPTSITRYGKGYNSGYGRVNCIAFHPTDPLILYIGLPQGGIWRSVNGGTSWSVLTDDLPSTGISDLVVSWANANVIYALTGDGDVSAGGYVTSYGYDQKSVGVLRSTDGGVTWFLTGALPNAGETFYGYKLIQHPNFANILFAATTSGIYKTSNSGVSWTQVESDTRFTDIEFKPNDASIMYAVRRMNGGGETNSNPFYRSTNTGDTWTNTTTGITTTAERLAIGVSKANISTVYLLTGPSTGAGSFKGLYRSTNSGVSFSNIATTPNILGYPTNGSDAKDQTFYDLGIEVSPTNAEIVLTAGINIWRSTTGGTNLTARTQWFDDADDAPAADYVHADVHNLAYNPLNNYVYSCSDGGVGRSTDNGANWTFLSSNLHILATYHADWYEPNASIMTSGTQDNGTNVRYTGSNTYRHIYGADGFDCIMDQNNPDDIVYVANSSVYRTTDGGLTNDNAGPAGVGTFPQLARSYTDDNDIFAGDKTAVYRSTTRGTSWSSSTTPRGSRALTTCPSNSSRIYASNGTNTFRSDDKAVTWTTINGKPGYPTGVNLTDIESRVNNSLDIYASFGGYSAGKKVYFSTDGGENWSNISGSLPNLACHSIAVDANFNVYVGTDIGVFVRPSGESDWQPFLNSLPRTPVSELMVNNTANRIIATTFGRGNWFAELYSPCPATGTLIVGGTLTGQRFYEYNSISSTAIITGGEGTHVAMKAMDYVQLNPGFEAKQNNDFRAYLGPCGNGGVPFTLGLQSVDENFSMENVFIPSENGKRWPYAHITEVLRQESSIEISTENAGLYSIRITDVTGKVLKMKENLQFEKGIQKFNYAGLLQNEAFYIQLLKDKRLVHFQEL